MISSIDKIPSLLTNQLKELVFVDDFSGSGNQMKSFLENSITIRKKKYRLCDLPDEF